MKNESIYLVRDQQFTYRDSQMPTPGDKDVVVEIRHIGVCGSDVAFFTEHTMHGALDFELPIILGHECAGVVVQTGAGVEHLRSATVLLWSRAFPAEHANIAAQAIITSARMWILWRHRRFIPAQ